MAFAEYFHKNIQSASAILQGFKEEGFRAVLEGHRIGIAFDDAAVECEEGKAALDLTLRLTARFYPSLALAATGKEAKKCLVVYQKLAKEINPRIDVVLETENVSHWLVVGKSAVTSHKGHVFYVGSDSWVAKLSTVSPVGSGKSANPFGAGVAACLGVANVFRAVFADQLPGSKPDDEIAFSVLDFKRKSRESKNPSISDIDLGELHLVGAGAVGNGFLWALSQCKARGHLYVIDAENLELSNVQRYAMSTITDVGKPKAVLAGNWAATAGAQVTPQVATWEDYVASRGDWIFERVAVAVDNANTRIHVQAALPKVVFNSWTQAGEAGLSRHGFVGDEACLACLYLPKRRVPNFDEIVLRALKLPNDGPHLMEVRARLDTGQPTEREYLERIAKAANVPLERINPFEGKPLRSFYVEAICGGAVLEFVTADDLAAADVPMAFQSALAGILLCADVVAEVMALRPRLPTITQIDLLRPFPTFVSTHRKKDPDLRCICGDQDFIAQYDQKYPTKMRAGRAKSPGTRLARR
jgi:hypothetical protein